jgi:molybdopterin synthase sulfur carrier subunit
VKVTFYATLRQVVGGRTAEVPVVPGATADDLLHAASGMFPGLGPLIWNADGGLRDYIRVVVNGRQIEHLDGLATVIPAEASIDIFPPVAGG